MALDKKEASRRIIIYLESLENNHVNPDWKNNTIKTLRDYINDEATAFDVWRAFEKAPENCFNTEVLIKMNSLKYLFHASL